MSELTPSQTIGPFFYEALKWLVDRTHASARPDEVSVFGRVLDGNGEPVSDALLEVWVPSSQSSSPLSGFQRMCTDASGRYTFHLLAPTNAPVHANVTIFARGLLRGLFTRVYLAPENHNALIPVPTNVPDARRHTLIGRPSATVPGRVDWDIRLQGENETVFFSLR